MGLSLIAPVLTYAQQSGGNRPAEAPHHMICASRKDQNALLAATMIQTGYGKRAGQAPRALDLGAPLGTTVARWIKHAPIAAFFAQQNGRPRMGAYVGHDARDPINTIAARGSHQMPVAAWFAKNYGTDLDPSMGEPLHTVTTKDRLGHMRAALAAPPFAPEHHDCAWQAAEFLHAHGAWDGDEFVTLAIGADEFIVVDIGMRMLTPRELFIAQGFPVDYVIEGVWEGLDSEAPNFRAFPKDVQVSCCGNSVGPPLAAAIVGANCGHHSAAHVPTKVCACMTKFIGDGQLSDLGMQRPHRLLVNLGLLLAATLEDVRSPVKQRLLPLLDHRRMHAVFGASSDTVRSPFTASTATRALKPASWFLRFRIPDLLVLGDQQTSDRSFRHCPISGE